MTKLLKCNQAKEDLIGTDKNFVERLIRDSEGAELLSCSKATWWRRVADKTLPAPIKIGSMTRWKLSEVYSAIESFEQKAVSDDSSVAAERPSKRSGQA